MEVVCGTVSNSTRILSGDFGIAIGKAGYSVFEGRTGFFSGGSGCMDAWDSTFSP